MSGWDWMKSCIQLPSVASSPMCENDPYEQNDLVGNPDYAQRVEAMMDAIRQWQKQLGDPLPLVSDQPKNPKFTMPAAAELARLRGE